MQTTEVWKDVPDYEGLYQVSNLGRVKSLLRTDNKGFNNCKRTFKEKIQKPVLQKSGYMLCSFTKNYITKKFLLHRIIAKTFIINIYNKNQVNHINGNKSDNRVENLEWCTASENGKHAWNNGLIKLTDKMIDSLNKGRRHNAKLTNEEIQKIRNINYYFGLYVELSKKYNLSPQAIRNIYKNKTYKNE